MFNGTLKESVQFSHQDFFKIADNAEERIDREKYIFENCVHEKVWNDYQAYIESGKYPYLSSVTDFCIGQNKDTEFSQEEKDNLHTQMYYCSGEFDRRRTQKLIEVQSKAGWQTVSKELLQSAVDSGKKVVIQMPMTSLLGSSNGSYKEVVCTVIKNEQHGYLMFPPRCSRKGYSYNQLIMTDEPTFIKLSNQ